MQLAVFATAALCLMVIVYTLGLNGVVSALVFLLIVLIGIFLRASEPIRARLRP